MIDEQIEKALECCAKEYPVSNDIDEVCEYCPYKDQHPCGPNLSKDALALIKRLKEEKEEQFKRLGKEIYALCSKIVDLQKQLTLEAEWIGIYYFNCSACLGESEYKTKYCPYCGAKMKQG